MKRSLLTTDADAERVDRLVELAPSLGWRAALDRVYGPDHTMVRYVTEPSRQQLIDLLPLTPQSVILEIGPGLGQFTQVLAKRTAFIHAIEVEPGQAAFVVERCRQQGITNLSLVCGGEDCRLPFSNAVFDGIVLNLVFEWCASRCHDEDPNQVQRRLLSEMNRVLKPGGWLFLNTKNRFALSYLTGQPDEHVFNMRFGSALPRWLMNLILKLESKPRPPGRLYSYRALARMLRSAGFGDLKSFWLAPELRYPTHFIPTDAPSIRQARRTGLPQGNSGRTRLLMPRVPAALVRHFTPGLTFLVRKPV